MSENNDPIISTISPCYKMEKYLELFLDMLPYQTCFDRLEVVLDHNEPTEKELDLVRKFQEKYPGKINHTIVDKVDPIGTSMNRCIRKAKGEYLAIWNVDDLRTRDSLENQLKTLQNNPGCDVVHGSFLVVRSFGSTHGVLVDSTQYVSKHKELTRGMTIGPFFMFKKRILEKSGIFDEQLKSGADYDLAVRMAIHNPNVVCVPGILGYYLDEGKGASTRGDGRQPTERTLIELRYGIYDKIEKIWLEKTKDYKIDEVLIDGSWRSIREFVPNYDNFIKNNI